MRLIDEILTRVWEREDNPSISLGVVTPFRAQANEIRKLMSGNAQSARLKRVDFTVETAHGYQGDERDVIIFSPVVSRGMKNSTCGFLSTQANIFNVAITRARSELHVVGDSNACAASGIKHLADFVEYVREYESNAGVNNYGTFESIWEELLYKALKDEGIETIPQYNVDQYRLDLAIPDSENPIGIEC